MDNTFENENLDSTQGQINDNVGQDVNEQGNENSETNWEEQSKYHQSEKDKLYAENQKLKQYEQIGQMLESRPDIVQTISGMMQGGQPTTNERITLEKDEFDSWEAYNDPSSKSYKYRQQEMQDAVDNAVKSQMAGVQKEVGMTKLQTELANKGLNQEQISSFMEFASKNPAEYGIDGAINMWQAVTQNQSKETKSNPLDAIRQNQNSPQQAGILNGQQPVRKDESQNRWEGVMKASRVGNKIP